MKNIKNLEDLELLLVGAGYEVSEKEGVLTITTAQEGDFALSAQETGGKIIITNNSKEEEVIAGDFLDKVCKKYPEAYFNVLMRKHLFREVAEFIDKKAEWDLGDANEEKKIEAGSAADDENRNQVQKQLQQQLNEKLFYTIRGALRQCRKIPEGQDPDLIKYAEDIATNAHTLKYDIIDQQKVQSEEVEWVVKALKSNIIDEKKTSELIKDIISLDKIQNDGKSDTVRKTTENNDFDLPNLEKLGRKYEQGAWNFGAVALLVAAITIASLSVVPVLLPILLFGSLACFVKGYSAGNHITEKITYNNEVAEKIYKIQQEKQQALIQKQNQAVKKTTEVATKEVACDTLDADLHPTDASGKDISEVISENSKSFNLISQNLATKITRPINPSPNSLIKQKTTSEKRIK